VPPGPDAVRQDRAHVIDGAGQDDDLRKVPVGTGVGGVADQVRNPVPHLVLAHQLDQVVLQGGRGALQAGGIDGIILGRTRGPADGPHVRREHFPRAMVCVRHASLSQRPAGRASGQAYETGPIVRALLTMNAAAAAPTVEGVDVREKIVPIYQCISPEGLLDESARGKLAEEITRIHCDATGVPPSFVNVIFTDVPDGRYFVAGSRPATRS
jgi:phenylpyruvate tautomerase PptA (4-oxalocrotonate tautomerase family)